MYRLDAAILDGEDHLQALIVRQLGITEMADCGPLPEPHITPLVDQRVDQRVPKGEKLNSLIAHRDARIKGCRLIYHLPNLAVQNIRDINAPQLVPDTSRRCYLREACQGGHDKLLEFFIRDFRLTLQQTVRLIAPKRVETHHKIL